MTTGISNVSYISEFESKYQKGMEMTYTVNGKERTAEFNQKMGSVSILLFHKELEKFVLVRQFRPAIFTSRVTQFPENHGKPYEEINWPFYDPELGYTVELCAGLIDKEGLSPRKIASEEVAEECGYKVTPSDLQPISTFVVGAHQSGNAQYMYYAEIDESMRIGDGGGNVHEGEVIQKVYWTVEEASKVARPADGAHCEVNGPPGVLFAFQWWFLRREKQSLLSTASEFTWSPRNVKCIRNVAFSTDFDKKKYGYNPKRMTFTLGAITRTWDLALCPDTATCILVDSEKKELILLQTMRTQVLIGKSRTMEENKGKKLGEVDFSKTDPSEAYTLELPVNRVPYSDSPRKFARIAAKQIGYDLPEMSFQLIAKCVPGIGQSGDTQHMFLADVRSARICEKEEDEDVEEVRIPFAALPSVYRQVLIGPPTTYFAIGYVIDKF